jgi:alginate O-acetyltransferase complex protein AlgI
VRRYTNLWIVMLLGGLWHGAGWQFVFWGALHGAYLTVNHLWSRHAPLRLPYGLSFALTFICVVLAWVFFRAADFSQAFAIVQAMTMLSTPAPFSVEIFDKIDLTLVTLLIAAMVAWFAPNALDITERFQAGGFRVLSSIYLARVAGIVMAASLFKTYASGSNAFIYFQF